MHDFRVIAIDETMATRVRRTLRAPFADHRAEPQVATGYGPCRLCLGRFEEGVDERILFTFDPFDGLEELPLPGPVFIHAEDCPGYPPDAGFPEPLRSLPLTLNAYGQGRTLVAQRYVTDGAVEPALSRLFRRSEVDYVHVRNSEAGCYICRIERPAKH